MLIIILDCFANARNDGISGCFATFYVIPDSDSESVSLHKLYNVTKCKDEFKRSETLVKLALWYGMVWWGGARQ